MIDTILTLFYVVAAGMIGGVATYWLMSLLGDPHEEQLNTRAIFSFYGLWVKTKYEEYEKRLENYLNQKPRTMHEQERIEVRNLNWYKSLGACPFCFGVYVTAFISITVFYFTGVSLWWVFLALPMFHVTLKLCMDRL